MRISLTKAKRQSTDLTRSAEADSVPMQPNIDAKSRGMVLGTVRTIVSKKATASTSAARSQDFLYGKDVYPIDRGRSRRRALTPLSAPPGRHVV